MKNHKIDPKDIVNLVNLSTSAFEAWNEIIPRDITNNPNLKAEYLRFASDMLDELIKAAYPLKDKPTKPFTAEATTKSPFDSLHPLNHLDEFLKVMRDELW